jgi:hypothetical protein
MADDESPSEKAARLLRPGGDSPLGVPIHPPADSIPSAPRANSTYEPPDELARQLGAIPPAVERWEDYARRQLDRVVYGRGVVEREDREDRQRKIADAIEKSAEDKTVAEHKGSTSDHERHPTTKTLDYLALGVILAPAPEVIAMYLRHEDIDWLRVAISFVASTAIGSLILWFAHGWRQSVGALAALKGRINSADDYFAVRAAIIAFFMIAPVLIAPLISGQSTMSPSPVVGFTQQQVDAKVADALVNVNAQLADARQQRDAAVLQLAKANRQASLPPSTPPNLTDSQHLIAWDENLGDCNSGNAVCGLLIGGKNTSSTNIKFTKAQLVSVDGEVVDLKIDLGPEGRVPATEAKIPPGAPFVLWLELPGNRMTPSDFIAKWGRSHLNTEYQGVTYSRAFDEDKMREMLGSRAFEPHPSRDK